ncbi:Carnitine/acyl carnitine carrier, variant 2 [Balamuthia mandrillaris]
MWRMWPWWGHAGGLKSLCAAASLAWLASSSDILSTPSKFCCKHKPRVGHRLLCQRGPVLCSASFTLCAVRVPSVSSKVDTSPFLLPFSFSLSFLSLSLPLPLPLPLARSRSRSLDRHTLFILPRSLFLSLSLSLSLSPAFIKPTPKKGLTPPLTGVSITNATAFSGYGAMRRVVMGREALPAEMTLPQVMLAGAGTGILSGLVTAPIDVVKTQLQVQALSSSPSSSASSAGNAASLEASRGGSVHYAGPIDCIRRVGLRGMFIGLSATWIRDIVGFGIYFSCYELVRRALLEKDFSALQHNDTFALKKLSLPQQLLAGSVVGLCSGVITQPLDVIKSRIQGQVLHFSSSSSSSLWLFRPPPERTMYKGFLDCARQSNKEGARQVYLKGFGPALGRAIPVTATILLVYEYLIQVLPE